MRVFQPIHQAIYGATIGWYDGFIYCVADIELLVMLAMALFVFMYLKRLERRLTMPSYVDDVSQPDRERNKTE